MDPDKEAARSRLAESDRADVVFYDTLDDMVARANLDGLMVGTRCNLHTHYAIQAASYDIPLYLEKPISTSMEQALALEKAFENSRCQVVVSFPLRATSICREVRRHIVDGAVGDPEHILGVNYVPYGTVYFDDNYRDYSITQGLFLQKATHDFDYMSYLLNSSIVRVAASASYGRVFGGKKPAGLRCSACDEADRCNESPRNRKMHCSPGSGYDDHWCVFGADIGSPETGMNEDSSSALIEFAGGVKGVYTQVFFTRRDAAARGATVSGYDGTLNFDWFTNEIKYVRHHAPYTTLGKVDQGGGHGGGDRVLAVNFFDVIRGKAPSLTSIWTGLQSLYACLAAKQSAEKGVFVDVRQAL